ncbi:MAG: prolipoprotein diacylglyceryl transferase [Candidatus Omnitrophica bacterium]|nr:prolipoprotein diacylglyceryl transferase [Candidatus Omnitrophota bacterium]
MHKILFEIGPLTVYSYGTFIALGYLTATILVLRGCPRYGFPKDKMWTLLTLILIFGLIGARLLNVILKFKFYMEAPLSMIFLHRGGLAIQGGIVGGIGISIFYLFKNRLSVWKTGDLILQNLPLGQAIGRIGCYLNGCCFGRWGLPTQLFMSAGFFITFIILKYLAKKRPSFDGSVFISYFLIYPAVRFFIDFLRGDLRPVFMGLTESQYISLLFFIAAFFIYILKKRRHNFQKERS